MLMAVPELAAAKEKKHAPLSANILAAKTVYIENRTGSTKVADKAYEELESWGRFRVVTDRKDADLILLFSKEEYVAGSITSGGSQTSTGNIDESGNMNVETQRSPASTSVLRQRRVYMTVVDPKTGDNLWNDSTTYSGWTGSGYASHLVKRFKQRIEEQSSK